MTIFIATLDNGRQVSRTSNTMRYTHATVGIFGVNSWHTSHTLACRASNASRGKLQVVPVVALSADEAKARLAAERKADAADPIRLARLVKETEQRLDRAARQLAHAELLLADLTEHATESRLVRTWEGYRPVERMAEVKVLHRLNAHQGGDQAVPLTHVAGRIVSCQQDINWQRETVAKQTAILARHRKALARLG